MVRLAEHFASKDRSRHSEWLRQQRWFIKARQDQERRDKLDDRLEDDITSMAVDAVMATEAQIRDFEIELDQYDEATVMALMENQDLLDAVTERIDAMLGHAFVLPDGRRVFRTEDGTQVFDEFGEEVGADVVDPQMIDPSLPTWEAFNAELEQKQDLEAQRTDILKFQEKLDDAHEQIADGEISEDDLNALDAELEDLMPAAVRAHVSGMEPKPDAPDAAPTPTTAPATPSLGQGALTPEM